MNSRPDNPSDFRFTRHWFVHTWDKISVPAAAVMLALAIGAIIILFQKVNPFTAYFSLLKGSFGDLSAIGRTLEKTTPLVMGGLAVAFAFKAGLFNIGAQGQLLFGAMVSALVGFGIEGLPSVCHIPLGRRCGPPARGSSTGTQPARPPSPAS